MYDLYYDNQEDVSPAVPIVIDFAPVIDYRSILNEKGVMVKSVKNNKEIEGGWEVSHGGTRYTFTPGQDLTKNEKYTVLVTRQVKDKAGAHLDHKKPCISG